MYTEQEILDAELEVEKILCNRCVVDNDSKDCSSCDSYLDERDRYLQEKRRKRG